MYLCEFRSAQQQQLALRSRKVTAEDCYRSSASCRGQQRLMLIRSVLLLVCTAVPAQSHGMMNRPSPRNNRGDADFSNLTGCAGEACYWYQVGCMSGCKCAGFEKAIVTAVQYSLLRPLICQQRSRYLHAGLLRAAGRLQLHHPQGANRQLCSRTHLECT